MKKVLTALMCTGALIAAACGDDSTTTDAGVNTDAATQTLYAKLGGEAAITAVIEDFLGRATADVKINAFFLNAGVNGTRLKKCLIKQVSAATGAPGVTYPSGNAAADADGCRNMKAIHQGMKISMNDMNDLVADLSAAMTAKGVSTEDQNTIKGALAPLFPEIIEDSTNNMTIYQRVGRKPAIASVIDGFIGRVVADAQINGFFSQTVAAPARAARLKTCLVRQVCEATGGPCVYNMGVEDELKVNNTVQQCADMMSVHQNAKSPQGDNNGRAITIQDFNALVTDLSMELTAKGVTDPDKTAILNALAPLCRMIVANGTGCP